MQGEIKAFVVRMPKDLWFYLKKNTLIKEKSMNEMVVACIEKYRETEKKKAKKRRENR